MWIWWEITIWYFNMPVYSLFQAHTQPNQVEKVIVSASFISNNSFSFLPFSLSFIEFSLLLLLLLVVRHQLTMHGNILQTEYWEKKQPTLFIIHLAPDFLEYEIESLAELYFYAWNLWSNITNIINCASETVTSYGKASTMNRMMCSQWAKYFNFVTVFSLFFLLQEEHSFCKWNKRNFMSQTDT